MIDILIENEPVTRLLASLGVLAAMACWELASPRRRIEIPRVIRWSNNFGMVILDAVLVRLCFPVAAVGVAVIAEHKGWGLFNRLEVPGGAAALLAILLLDFIIYVQHVLSHAVPWLWRLHRVHHADQAIDVTTGLRFHPLEIVLSMAVKLVAVGLLGAPVAAVLVFEILLNGTALFNHSNIRLPLPVDRVLRFFIVTPDMHRVHHSIHVHETNSNFGFNLPWWDRLLGTYVDQPRDGHTKMLIGLKQFRTVKDLRLDRMLTQPFRGPANHSPVIRPAQKKR